MRRKNHTVLVYVLFFCVVHSALHAEQASILFPGVPVDEMVYRGIGRRFKLRVGFEAESLTLLLSPMYGDADLYVRFGSPPDLSNYDYLSSNFNTQVDTITISEDAICSNCWIHILVYGFSTTEFALLATFVDGTSTLSNGVPQRGSVAANMIQYYNYEANSDCSVTVVLTVTSGFVPSLYLSTSVVFPNATTPDTIQRKGDSGDGAVPRVIVQNIKKDKFLHVAVAGDGHNVTYTIRVFETPDNSNLPLTLLTLVDGFPQVLYLNFNCV